MQGRPESDKDVTLHDGFETTDDTTDGLGRVMVPTLIRVPQFP